ncbi:hypothetical protein ACIBSW_16770 [Actinoplanes sp. NPDC049668]|uniref:hypothetical protein n=1 Tax=unclassified Actinoplanes TaxID=2626549 RepID=UPI0033BEFBB7
MVMVDYSDDDDDGPIDLSHAADDEPFDIGDIVALDPRYYDQDDPALEWEGEVLDLRASGRGWQVLVDWEFNDRTWMPHNRLIDAD